ncbi:hypothetical protein [Vibrio phage BONAISHI]|nr:hypothetical protein [Vibrio phage BONAISHI]
MLVKSTEELCLLMAEKCIAAWNDIPGILDSGVIFTQVTKNLAFDISVFPERVEISGVMGLLPSTLIIFANEEPEIKITGTDETDETFIFPEIETYLKMMRIAEGIIRTIMQEKELWISKN